MVLRHSSKIPVVAQVVRGEGLRRADVPLSENAQAFQALRPHQREGCRRYPYPFEHLVDQYEGWSWYWRSDASEDPRIRPEFLDMAG